MLICIADSEYFNIALKAYINEPNSKPLDIKEILCYPFSGQSEMFYTFFATDAGARLSTILIDYSSVSIEVLQVALSLKSFNPLIRIFIFAKSGYPLSELERSLAIVLGAEFITSFAGLSAALARGPRLTSPPADKLYIAIPDSYNLTRKETFLISL
ncbi:LuxR C-terminal-related transcriptional regulator, partial [Klebsiella pneumoniae]